MRTSTLPGLSILLACFAASAQDRFEIQVYDSEVAEAGHFGLELHTNYGFAGRREPSPEGELPTEHVLRATLEPHVGVFGWGEVGAYLQSALRPGGPVDYAGVKLRFKAKWPDKLLNGALGLAFNVELSRLPADYEANVWGTELRPIVDLRLGPVYGAVNPIVGIDLQGSKAGHPQFDPAFKLAFFARPEVSFGGEYYAGLGPFDSFSPAAQQSHQLYAVMDLAGDLFDLNVGLGRGFGAADPWVAKAIIGIHPKVSPPPRTPEGGR